MQLISTLATEGSRLKMMTITAMAAASAPVGYPYIIEYRMPPVVMCTGGMWMPAVIMHTQWRGGFVHIMVGVVIMFLADL